MGGMENLSLTGSIRRLSQQLRAFISSGGRARDVLRKWRGLVVGACLLLAAFGGLQAKQAFSARAVYVPDGDTVWVVAEGESALRKLRLHGIDAPEICQPGGLASRRALQELVNGQILQVQVRYHDSYGRGLASLELFGQDLAERMVQEGHAWSYRWRRSLGPYARQEAEARRARLGLFAQDTFELPRNFRQRHGSCQVDRPGP